MTTLTEDEKTELRRNLHAYRVRSGLASKESRECLDKVHQCLEDEFEKTRTTIFSGIDSVATTYGITYTANEKDAMLRHWLLQKRNREAAKTE